jgi:hypothetical protein
MADFDTTLVQQVFDVAKRKRKSNIKHRNQADDLRAGFKVAKWRAFCHPKRLGWCPARLNKFSSDRRKQLLQQVVVLLCSTCLSQLNHWGRVRKNE